MTNETMKNIKIAEGHIELTYVQAHIDNTLALFDVAGPQQIDSKYVARMVIGNNVYLGEGSSEWLAINAALVRKADFDATRIIDLIRSN